MKIASTAFDNNQKIPRKYTCDGDNINPPLLFTEVPAGTNSLSLIVDDPDAPGGTFVHWVLYNIDPNITKIEEDSVPKSAMTGKSSLGKLIYVGVCPPPASPEQLQRGESGIHRYHFKLYALDTVLDLTGPDEIELEAKMEGHILEKAELVGLYGRETP